MLHTIGHHLFACGKKSLPKTVTLGDTTYNLSSILKHDFFAATSLYELLTPKETSENKPSKIILKINRIHNFLGLPLLWLGQLICEHEFSILKKLSHLPQVPHILCRYGKTGFIYEYIEGRSLDEKPDIPDDFFDELLQLIYQIHLSDIVYLDANKKGNILVADDGKPWLIDFQISLHLGKYCLLSKRLSGYLREILQWSDLYHLLKHKRRLSPEQLKPHETKASRHKSIPIKIHRRAVKPLQKLRRNFLRHMYEKGHMSIEDNSHLSRENNPERFAKLK